MFRVAKSELGESSLELVARDNASHVMNGIKVGTTDRIPDVNYMRNELAVKSKWKEDCSKVVTYEVKDGVSLGDKIGLVGPQIDLDENKYLRGGGSQINILYPDDVDKMDLLKPIT